MKKRIVALLASVAITGPAIAEELTVVGSWSSLSLHNDFEAPFWGETLPTASGGEISTSVTTHNQMNLGVGEVFRLLGQGVYDVAMTVGDYAVSDAPELEGLDVPLVAMSADKAQAAVEAARPMVEEIFKNRFNAQVLAVAPYPPQVVFCNKEVGPAMNLDKWKTLDGDTQALIMKEVAENFEAPAWAVAQDALVNDVACLTGNGECGSGDTRSMTLVAATDADIAKARGILEAQVLPEWAERAGGDWATRWNDSVGKVVGVSITAK